MDLKLLTNQERPKLIIKLSKLLSADPIVKVDKKNDSSRTSQYHCMAKD